MKNTIVLYIWNHYITTKVTLAGYKRQSISFYRHTIPLAQQYLNNWKDP